MVYPDMNTSKVKYLEIKDLEKKQAYFTFFDKSLMLVSAKEYQVSIYKIHFSLNITSSKYMTHIFKEKIVSLQVFENGFVSKFLGKLVYFKKSNGFLREKSL